MDSGKLLWATGLSPLRREKRKKSSDDAATDGDPGAFVLLGDVAWPTDVEEDGRRKMLLATSVTCRNEKRVKSQKVKLK